MKKALKTLLAGSMVFGLAACSSSSSSSTSSASAAASTAAAAETTTAADDSGTYEIAMITDVGNIDDHSFNQATYEATKEFAEANGKTFNYFRPSEDSTTARVEQIENAISKGAKTIVCPGYLFEEAIYDVQDQYPDVNFLLIDGQPHDADYNYKTSSNVHCIIYKEEEAGYFAGYAVVQDGYTELGFCGGMAVPAVIRYGYGYIQGAAAAAEELGVNVNIKYYYAGAFAPSDDLYNKMDSWYLDGTQIVFACGGKLYESVFKAAEDEGGMSIGVDVDQVLDSETVLTSAEKKLKETTTDALTALYDNGGTWPEDYAGTTANLGAAEGATGLPTDDASWRFATFTKEQYEALYEKVASGEITINNDTEIEPTAVTDSTLVTVDYQN